MVAAALTTSCTPPVLVEYQQYVASTYNRRVKEMDCLLSRLALFLDPRYKTAAMGTGSDITELYKEVRTA